jgi:hypothetical protein
MHGPGPVVEGQGIGPLEAGLEGGGARRQALGDDSLLGAGLDLEIVGVGQLPVGVEGQAAKGQGRAVVGHLDKGGEGGAIRGRAQGKGSNSLVVAAVAQGHVAQAALDGQARRQRHPPVG